MTPPTCVRCRAPTCSGWRERSTPLSKLTRADVPMGVGSIQHCVRFARADARLPVTTHVHTLRHSYATHLLEQAEREGARVFNRPRALRDPAVQDAYGWYDGSQGMLTYALVRQGRAPEAVDIAQANLAGGGEAEHWSLTNMFDAMGALSTQYNDTPEKASRAYDKNRDGFVIAGGAGIVVVEDMDRAKARGATIYAEIVGYAANSDGFDMVAPSGEGATRCMKLANADGRTIDYLNPHGTSTPVGDLKEMEAVRAVFGDKAPLISSTKSLTGHSLGAAGAQEAIYCLLMMEGGFIAGSANVETRDPAVGDLPLVTETRDARLTTVMSNSFGFGGTNAALVMKAAD